MSNLENYEPTLLQKTFREARLKAGKDAVRMVLVAHGATTGLLPDVPTDRQGDCLKALRKLADGSTAPGASGMGRTMDDVRRSSFARMGSPESVPSTPPRELNSAAIFQRWNNPPATGD